MRLLTLEFHHVGVGTPKFEAAIETYVQLGHRLHSRIDDPVLDVRIAFLRAPGDRDGTWIEILSPLSPDGPLKSYLERRALPAPYHTCYVADDLAEATARLRDLGFLPLGEPKPALAFGGRPVVFFLNRNIGMIELVQGPVVMPPLGLDPT